MCSAICWELVRNQVARVEVSQLMLILLVLLIELFIIQSSKLFRRDLPFCFFFECFDLITVRYLSHFLMYFSDLNIEEIWNLMLRSEITGLW